MTSVKTKEDKVREVMGVYVFKSKHGPFLKVGHYCKESPWSRVAHRGFEKIRHPPELDGKTTADDLELMGWDESLGFDDESDLHRLCKNYHVMGEWFSLDAWEVLELLLEGDISLCDKDAAMATWRRL